MIAAANLNLRTAERVLLLLAPTRPPPLMNCSTACYSIPWEELLPADAAFPVKGSSLSSQLSSVPACQSIVKKAIVKRLMTATRPPLCRKPVLCTRCALPCAKTWWK